MIGTHCCRHAAPLSPSILRSLSSRSLSTTRTLERKLAPSQWSSRPSPLPSAFLTRAQRRHYAEVIIKVPEMAESISEGTLKQWSKAVGDQVQQDEEIATIETDKIDVSVNAPAAGVLKELLAQEEDTVSVGQEIGKMDGGAEGGKTEETAGSQPKEPAADSQQTSSQPQGQKEKDQPKEKAASNQSQQQPRQQQSSPQPPSQQQQRPQPQSSAPSQQQSSPSKQVEQPKQQQQSSQPKEESPKATPGSREERRVKMNRMRLRISERLKQSQNTAASLTTFQKVDMSSLMEFRKTYRDEILKSRGIKLGFMGAFTRASVLAMKDVPNVNASIEGPGGGDTIVYRDYVDVSVAVATEKGLVTPVVRNAENMDMVGIEGEIANLGKKARDNKLTIEDMAGGTYTISNGGVFGSLFGTPIINLPQTAVLGLHAINDEVVMVNGKPEARPIMYLALTYDHRLLDGREAVTFLVKVKQYIEDPRKMLLG